MKKLLTFMLCICTASMSYAQLKVYSNGRPLDARQQTIQHRLLLLAMEQTHYHHTVQRYRHMCL